LTRFRKWAPRKIRFLAGSSLDRLLSCQRMSQIPSLRITELSLKLSVAIFVVSGRSKRFFRRFLVVLRNNSARNTSEPCIPEYLKDAISFTYRSKTAYQSLSDSHSAAISSFYRMQQRLIRNPINVSENSDFFAEYKNLSYMTKNLPTKIVMPDQHYYIPHHAVLRDSSTTTWLQVFNASHRTTNGMSLNDHMLIGPKLQKDLATCHNAMAPKSLYIHRRYRQNVSENSRRHPRHWLSALSSIAIFSRCIYHEVPSLTVGRTVKSLTAQPPLLIYLFEFWINLWKMKVRNFRSQSHFYVVRYMLTFALSAQTMKYSPDRSIIS